MVIHEHMRNDHNTTKTLAALRRITAPNMGVLFVGRVSNEYGARARGGVLRFFPHPLE